MADLRPGVTEISIRPALDTPELRAVTGDWEARVDDHLVTGDAACGPPSTPPASRASATGPLRDLQRAG